MLEVVFRSVREKVQRKYPIRRGVLFRVQNEGGTHALSARGGAYDQGTQKRISAMEF